MDENTCTETLVDRPPEEPEAENENAAPVGADAPGGPPSPEAEPTAGADVPGGPPSPGAEPIVGADAPGGPLFPPAEPELDLAAETARLRVALWAREAERAKARFPQLDLAGESQSASFRALLAAGVDVERAYAVEHLEELLDRLADAAAREAERRVVDGIRARGVRPRENGTLAHSAFLERRDVHSLTRAERADLARRALKGDKVRL